MRKLVSHFQITLDGFMSTPAGGLEWSGEYHDDAMWKEVFALMDETDTVLFGRKTYQLFYEYWPAITHDPSASSNDRQFAEWIDTIPKMVFSGTLQSVEWKNSTLFTTIDDRKIRKLKNLSGRNMLIFGSSTLASGLFNRGLIDEFRLNVHPVLIGKGKPFLKELSDLNKLTLMDAKPINAGAIGLHYSTGTK